jgi:hypothetical protein
MNQPPDRLVRASVVLTLLGIACFGALLVLSARGAEERMLFVALLTFAGFALTGFGVLGFFLVGVRRFVKPAPAKNLPLGPSKFSDPFLTDAWYRVRIDINNSSGRYGWDFPAGAVLRYLGSTYSAYDNCSGFRFADAEGKTLVWEVRDDDAHVQSWEHYFERVMPAPRP